MGVVQCRVFAQRKTTCITLATALEDLKPQFIQYLFFCYSNGVVSVNCGLGHLSLGVAKVMLHAVSLNTVAWTVHLFLVVQGLFDCG